MAEIRHLANRHDVIFYCWEWSELDKISQTGAEYVDCGDMVKIETRCKILIWRTFGRIPWHVIPEPPATLQDAATWWIHHDVWRVICHITGCNNSIRHIENRFSHILFFFCFLNTVWALTSGSFRVAFDTLVEKIAFLHFGDIQTNKLTD